MAKECLYVGGVFDHYNQVDMRCLYKDMTDSNSVKLACASEEKK
jgi:hypothetical protein